MSGGMMNEERIRAEIGRRLGDARRKAGLKLDDVASMMDVATRNVIAWENGAKSCTLPKLTILATMYGVSTDRVLGNFPPDHEGTESSRCSRLLTEVEFLKQDVARLETEKAQLGQLVQYLQEKRDAQTPTPSYSGSSPAAHHGYVPPSRRIVCGQKHWRRDTTCTVPYEAHTGPHDNGAGLRWTNEPNWPR